MAVLSLLIAATVLYVLFKLSQVGRRDKRLPPGPPTIPVLGNLHQIPVTGLYKKLKTWGDEYGHVYSLKLGPSTMIVLNNRRAIHDLMDKKGNIYSERPIDHVASLVTNGDSFAFMDNTPRWRNQRKIASHAMSPAMVDKNIAPLQEAEVSILLNDLLDTPTNFYNHVRRTTASVANMVVWGHRGQAFEDFWGSCVYRAMDQYSASLEPGANPPVDQFPFLQSLPDFLSPWRLRAKKSYKAMDEIWIEARRQVDYRRSKGEKRPCIADRIFDGETGKDLGDINDHQLNHFLGVIVEGGSDTTSASMLTSILLLALNPEVQRKAQAQLDEVLGTARSPLWSDFDKLPYINMVVKESVRWHPNLPMGVPHRLNEDDWYDGMLIPKGSSIVMPVWALHFSESEGFKDPWVYKPERFVNHPRLASEYAGAPEYENRDHYAYGAGRRICPGMHLAERTMWRMTAKLLWAYNIEPAVDPVTGQKIQLDPENYHEGISHTPRPYQVKFVPRSDAHIATIRKEAAKAREDLRPFD